MAGRYAVVDSSNKVVAVPNYAPDTNDLASRGEVAVGPLDPAVVLEPGYVYDPATGAFSPPPPPPRTFDQAASEKAEQLRAIRQQKIAAVLGTSVKGLRDREAYFLRLAAAAIDMQANPSAWYGRVIDGQTLGSTDADVLAVAQQIQDAQRQRNDAIEQIVAEYRAKMQELAAATTVDEGDAIVWV